MAAEWQETPMSYRFVEPPKPLGYWVPLPDVRFAVYDKMPNAFHRWMIRLCFGWRFERA